MRGVKRAGGFSVLGVLLLVALLALVFFTLWTRLKSEQAIELKRQAELAQATVPPDAVPTSMRDTEEAPLYGFGLSFALVPSDGAALSDVAHLSCHGDPGELDQPNEGSCNPYKGDTSCRVTLPVLCFKPGTAKAPVGAEADFYKGWTRGTLAATQPVMGALLDSAAGGSARCSKALGVGWRMAEFHDGGGGWGLQGLRGVGFGAWTRYWVHINDQPGNCWNPQS